MAAWIRSRVRPGAIHVHLLPESTEDAEVPTLPVVAGRAVVDAEPEIDVGPGHVEGGRHHTDDLHRAAVQEDGAPHDLGVGAERRLPEAVADDHQRRAVDPVVVGCRCVSRPERSPQLRFDPQ
jgi:hypothetical protein